jgi:peptide/nickel transport system substrate-binding protein
MWAARRVPVLLALLLGTCWLPVLAETGKAGGVLKIYHRGTPPSGSIHEEATSFTVIRYMGVYNNLVMYRQDDPRHRMETIIPDLATSWRWNDEKTAITFTLRTGVSWHDGRPFTSADVKCTWDRLQGKLKPKLRKNPRKAWYKNLSHVTTNGDFEATFHLHRRQPAFIALLASGYSPVYPCHVSPKQMRTHPIGTGPFKFIELKQNEHVKFARNPGYWKQDRPYLDGIEYTIIKSRSTRVLAFIAGKFDMTFSYDVTIPLMKDIQAQYPDAVCELRPSNVSTNLIVNREEPPFDNPILRRAMTLTIDRNAFIKILGHGLYDIGGAMLPPPAGVWGIPDDVLQGVAGYGPDIEKNREEARAIMRALGYGPDNPLKVKVAARNTGWFKDPAVILLDQLKQIYFDAELDPVEPSRWHSKVARRDYMIGLNLTGLGVDDPDVNFYENYSCDSERNYSGYCNPEIEKQFDRQSMEEDPETRRKLVWEIDKQLQEDGARPIIFHIRAATCWKPSVKGLVTHMNGIFNGWRMEDVWLDD